MTDMMGFAFHEGCKVVRAVIHGKSPYINICTVTKINNDCLYLDNSKQPIRFPNRLLIIEQDPLYRMIKTYKGNT